MLFSRSFSRYTDRPRATATCSPRAHRGQADEGAGKKWGRHEECTAGPPSAGFMMHVMSLQCTVVYCNTMYSTQVHSGAPPLTWKAGPCGRVHDAPGRQEPEEHRALQDDDTLGDLQGVEDALDPRGASETRFFRSACRGQGEEGAGGGRLVKTGARCRRGVCLLQTPRTTLSVHWG